MRTLRSLGLAVFCLSLLLIGPARGADADKPATSDQQRIQGTWKVVKKMKNGEAEDVEKDPATITFSGNSVKAVSGSQDKGAGTFTLDESKNPKWITMTGTSGPHAGNTFAAIYELDGDTLKLAYSSGEHNEVRPADFTGGSGQALEVLERVKP